MVVRVTNKFIPYKDVFKMYSDNINELWNKIKFSIYENFKEF